MTDNIFTILLVEDDEVDIMNVKRAFKKNDINYNIHIARNGIEALELLRKKGTEKLFPWPDYVLMDINMPKMGGIETLQELRNDIDLKALPVFMVTTSNEASDKQSAYDLNVAGYILKPIFFEQFVSAVGTINNYWQLIERPY
ncbi:MAG: response regulator [Bacteroidetes bacterium]|nr:response regulator [Bacteroidota bacterium]